MCEKDGPGNPAEGVVRGSQGPIAMARHPGIREEHHAHRARMAQVVSEQRRRRRVGGPLEGGHSAAGRIAGGGMDARISGASDETVRASSISASERTRRRSMGAGGVSAQKGEGCGWPQRNAGEDVSVHPCACGRACTPARKDAAPARRRIRRSWTSAGRGMGPSIPKRRKIHHKNVRTFAGGGRRMSGRVAERAGGGPRPDRRKSVDSEFRGGCAAVY